MFRVQTNWRAASRARSVVIALICAESKAGLCARLALVTLNLGIGALRLSYTYIYIYLYIYGGVLSCTSIHMY